MAWPMVAMMAGTALGMYGKKRTADKQTAYDSAIQEIMDKYKKDQHGIYSRDVGFENALSELSTNPQFTQGNCGRFSRGFYLLRWSFSLC